MLLHLLARIVEVLDVDRESERPPDALHALGELVDGECLGELIEDAQLALCRRMRRRERNALQRVAQVQIAAFLAAT
jgi:hypothetical protein